MLAGPVNLREESIAQAVQPLSWPRPRLPSAIVWGNSIRGCTPLMTRQVPMPLIAAPVPSRVPAESVPDDQL